MLQKTLLTILLLGPVMATAQTSMWGTGMYGGMQSCSTGMRAGNGATSIDDGTKEIQAELQEAQQQLKTKKAEKKKIDRTLQRTRTDVEKSISSDYADFIFEHMENSRRCEEYKGLQEQSGEFVAQGEEGDGGTVANADMIPVYGFSTAEWRQYCDRGKAGSVSGSVCSNSKYRETDGGRGSDATTCKKGLSDYRKQYSQSEKLQREIERMENQIANLKEDLKDAKADALEDRRNGLASSDTEGGVCIECIAQGNGSQASAPKTDWANVIANVGTGLFASYVGYKQNQMVAEYNSNAGWPTQSYPALSYGYPYLMAGLYGAVSGGTGQGSFGCGSGMNGTGNMNGTDGDDGRIWHGRHVWKCRHGWSFRISIRHDGQHDGRRNVCLRHGPMGHEWNEHGRHGGPWYVRRRHDGVHGRLRLDDGCLRGIDDEQHGRRSCRLRRHDGIDGRLWRNDGLYDG
ncbi:hypothetical protein [Bdellovibrio bacteriovorus]|uniref:hypothetical protein n=1 Tax=Bdellovibrio bacteriovorus TaxID=959 RepID=UPI0035A6B5D2